MWRLVYAHFRRMCCFDYAALVSGGRFILLLLLIFLRRGLFNFSNKELFV